MPASCEFTAWGDGIAVRALPGQAFTWTSLIQVRLGHPVGSSYLGGIFCPLLEARDIIIDFIIPALRPKAADITIVDWRIQAIEGTLGFEAGFTSTGNASTEGTHIQIEYDEGGKKFEEELFCTVTSFLYKIPAGGSEIAFVIWMADNMFSFRAEKGGLDGSIGVFQSMMHSFRLNPRWFEAYNRIVMLLKERRTPAPISLRRLSSEAHMAISADNTAWYEMRHSAYGWIARNLGRPGATTEYYDPVQQVCVRLPAGHDCAWANGDGEYVLLSPGDLPPDHNGMWKMMEPMSQDTPGREPPAMTEIS